MKILHATKKYPDIMGGDSTVVAGLAKYQRKIGHRVYVLTSNCSKVRKSAAVTKYGLKIDALNLDKINLKRIISLFILFFYLFFYLKRIKPDIVHSHSPDLGFILSFHCKLYGIPIINTCHGITFNDIHYSFIKRKLEEFFIKYSNFNKITIINKSSLKDFRKLTIKDVCYLPNGIDLELFQKERHNINRKTIFLFVGRIEEEKGLNYLIHAVNKLRKKEKGFEVLLVGKGVDQKYFQELVISLKLNNYIKFLGEKNINEVIDYYYKSDVLILPSLHESFPVTVLEAWAAKLPVIISNVGGVSIICDNKENAIMVPPGDSEIISEAMIALIKNPELRRELGENGRKLVEKNYGWDKIVKEIESIYKEIIK
ncbi:MAG: glycosyltransferase family 4 protein [Actinomycetia bacterium]|nr:glycosyltransferase family 4 protein [Actinomycetes bacterium]